MQDSPTQSNAKTPVVTPIKQRCGLPIPRVDAGKSTRCMKTPTSATTRTRNVVHTKASASAAQPEQAISDRGDRQRILAGWRCWIGHYGGAPFGRKYRNRFAC